MIKNSNMLEPSLWTHPYMCNTASIAIIDRNWSWFCARAIPGAFEYSIKQINLIPRINIHFVRVVQQPGGGTSSSTLWFSYNMIQMKYLKGKKEEYWHSGNANEETSKIRSLSKFSLWDEHCFSVCVQYLLWHIILPTHNNIVMAYFVHIKCYFSVQDVC